MTRELMASARKMPWLYVGNLPPKTPSADFLSNINGFLDRSSHLRNRPSCQALDCRTSTSSNKGGKSASRAKSFLFLSFKSEEDARWALSALNDLEYKGRRLRVELTRKPSGGKQTEEAPSVAEENDKEIDAEESTSNAISVEENDNAVWELFASKIRPKTPRKLLLSTINSALSNANNDGPLQATSCRVLRGFAFVAFSSKTDAERAIPMLDGFEFDGKRVKVPGPPVLQKSKMKKSDRQANSTTSVAKDEQKAPRDESDYNAGELDEHSAGLEVSGRSVPVQSAFVPRDEDEGSNNEGDMNGQFINTSASDQRLMVSEGSEPLAAFQSAFAKFVVESEKKEDLKHKELNDLKSEIRRLQSVLRKADLDLIAEQEKQSSATTDKNATLEIHWLKSELGKVRSELRRSNESKKKAEGGVKEIELMKQTVKGKDQKIAKLVEEVARLESEGTLMRRAAEQKEQQIVNLKQQTARFEGEVTKAEQRALQAESAAVQLKYLLANAEAKVSHLEVKLESANKRVIMAKQDYMNANDQVVAEKIKREAAVRKLQKKLAAMKEANKKETAKKEASKAQEAQKKEIPKMKVQGISVVNPKSLHAPIPPSPIPLSRESQIASLINFEAAYRDKQTDSGQVASLTKEEAEERRQAELEMIESSFPGEEVQIKRHLSATATITRHLSLSVESGVIGVILEINTTDQYLYKSDCKVEVNASISSPPHTAPKAIAETAKERAAAYESLPKLLASCRWETEMSVGEESIFGVLVAADTWARNEWPSLLLPKNPPEIRGGDNMTSGHVLDSDNSVSYNFGRILIYSHHIYDPDKLKQVIKLASNYQLGGIVKIGTPAFVLVEGLEENCQSYADDLIQFRTKMWEMKQSGKRDSATFSVLDKVSYQVNGIKALNEMKILPDKLKEIENDQLDELRSACSESGFDSVLEECLSLK